MTAPAARAPLAEPNPRTCHLPQTCFQIVDSLQARIPPPPSQEALPSELTLGLLHQVNNVLTGIYFNVEECREQIGDNHPVSVVIAEIAQATENLHRLLERTVDVNLPDSDDCEGYHDINSLTSAQLDLVRIVFPKTVSIDFTPSPEALHIVASERDFRRILLQLSACLRDTLPNGAMRLSLSVRRLPAGLIPGTDRWLPQDVASIELRGAQTDWCASASAIRAFHRTEFLASRFGWEVLPLPAILLPLASLGD